MLGIRSVGAGPIKLLQTKVDERYKVAIATHLFRSSSGQ